MKESLITGMEKKLKVCFFIYADDFAGAEKCVQDEIDYLDSELFDITLITSPIQAEIFRQRLKKNVPVWEINLNNNFFKALIDFKTLSKIYGLLKTGRFDVLSFHNNEAALIGGVVCLFVKRGKVFITEQNNLGSPEIRAYRDTLNQSFLKKLHLGSKITFLLRQLIDFRVTGYLAVSQAVKNYIVYYLKLPEHKVKVLKNSINAKDFPYMYKASDSLYQELNLDPDYKLVGVIGRLSTQKGHIFLLKAIPKIVKSVPKVHFVFAGDGEQRSYLEHVIRELGIEKHISVLGFRKDIPVILRNIDLMVLSSLWEGLPITVLECMATGVPVVASGVDGTLDIIEDGKNGFLVPPRDIDALAEKVTRVLTDSDIQKRFSLSGRKRIEQKFDVKKRTKRLASVFKSSVDQSSRAVYIMR